MPALPKNPSVAVADLPAVAEEVTAEWLSSVLGHKVKFASLDKFVPGTASKVFMTVRFDDDVESDPVKLCIKGGFQPEFLEQQPFLVSIYRREVDFYNRISPMLDAMALPRVRWASHTDKQGIIILDDLGARGCTFGSPTETWPVDRVKAGVEQLAALHSKTWQIQPENYPGMTSANYDLALLTLMQNYDNIVNGPGRPAVPAYLRDQARITAVSKKHFASRNPRFRCFVHGDPHTGNTYLEKGAPRFLDWQVMHIGSALSDIGYFVAGALSIEDRRGHEQEVLEHYLDSLKLLGGPDLSVTDEEVIVEYKKSFLGGIGWIMCPYEMQGPENVQAMAMRYAAALDDHKVLELVEALPEPEVA